MYPASQFWYVEAVLYAVIGALFGLAMFLVVNEGLSFLLGLLAAFVAFGVSGLLFAPKMIRKRLDTVETTASRGGVSMASRHGLGVIVLSAALIVILNVGPFALFIALIGAIGGSFDHGEQLAALAAGSLSGVMIGLSVGLASIAAAIRSWEEKTRNDVLMRAIPWSGLREPHGGQREATGTFYVRSSDST